MTDPFLITMAVLAVIIVGISKSGFGAAFGNLAVPLVALATAPAHAVALLLPSLMVMDVIGLVVFRRRVDVALLKRMIPAGLAGIAIGALTFRSVSVAGLKLTLGVLAVLFVLQRWSGIANRLHAAASERTDRWLGRFWSLVSGVTSFIAHAGGPPLSMYLIPRQMDRVMYVGTSAVFFAVINASKWVPYVWLDLFPMETLKAGLALALVSPVGYWLGLRSLRWFDGPRFYRVIELALLLSGLKLIWDGC
ncbi:sulfite exporter TauE/SafE family protein [Nitrogeniibacter mangrovi]|uniref:Probable membrane transporter protein n=1 Tax=Nitrogeniibacter mangrovi TaxID=2016596 RepID=A0A6C1B9G6_9RHOO|nr:sulfite exporter TauE/SafE family protein [Nitrogeniibacter mangrovi]QID19629.1 sulfite exporter TauE/SafE family protein [Nitrogeniibacter mangrovi]